jgi:DNA-binding NarL/FixJ family response regulator
MNEIRVLIIEDNPFLRNGIEALLNEQPDIKVIKAAADFEHVKSSLSKCKDGVILLDVSLHDQNSLRVTEKLSRGTSGHVIIVMDLFPLKEEIDEFAKAGAIGFINKDATLEEFLETIRAVAGGARILPDQLPGSLFSRIVEHAARSGSVRLDETALRITVRERKIIELVGEGISTGDIACKLKISPAAVRRHTDSIMEKLALRKVLLPGVCSEESGAGCAEKHLFLCEEEIP